MKNEVRSQKIKDLEAKIIEIANRELSKNTEVAQRQDARNILSASKCEKEIQRLKSFLCVSPIEAHAEHKIKYDNMRMACYYCGYTARVF
jgi:hypothetical protein